MIDTIIMKSVHRFDRNHAMMINLITELSIKVLKLNVKITFEKLIDRAIPSVVIKHAAKEVIVLMVNKPYETFNRFKSSFFTPYNNWIFSFE